MSAYADTSFLYSLYVQQAHSLRAAAYMATAGDAPCLSRRLVDSSFSRQSCFIVLASALEPDEYRSLAYGYEYNETIILEPVILDWHF